MKTSFSYVLVIFILTAFVAPARAENIAVVLSSDAAIYHEALEGFKEVARHKIVGVQTLKNDSTAWSDELKKLRSVIEPDVVFVLGTPALQTVSGAIKNIPIVYAMVFNPFSMAPSATNNVFGISMLPSANQVTSLIKELNPKYRRVGTMFDSSRSGPALPEIRSAFDKAGLQLITREIRSAGNVGAALKSLENEIDALWLWPDEAYLSDEILQRIFLFSFERKVPVLGLSERHIQMGAVISLSYASARDMGRQAGETANKLLVDSRSTQMATIETRQTRLAVNLKTAHKLGVDVPDSIIQRADNAVKAPIYNEGEWWVFRIKTVHPSGKSEVEDHRVIYKNGKFETDDPSFLTGGDLAGTPTFLPFASVYLTDSRRKWLDFPLLPGKKWSFRYPRRHYLGRGSRTFAVANGEVIGQLFQPLDTPAGKFDAIEIQRVDSLVIPAYLTYFYSPHTKSVIKLRAGFAPGGSSSTGRRFELDLVAHGNR